MITVDHEKFKLVIPDIGVTMRTMLAAAADGYRHTGRRTWGISYNGATIGKVRVKAYATEQVKEV